MLSIALERMDPRVIELCKCDGKCGNPGAGAFATLRPRHSMRLNNDPQASEAAELPATSMHGT